MKVTGLPGTRNWEFELTDWEKVNLILMWGGYLKTRPPQLLARLTELLTAMAGLITEMADLFTRRAELLTPFAQLKTRPAKLLGGVMYATPEDALGM